MPCGAVLPSLRLCQDRVAKFIGGVHYKKWTLFYRYQQQFGNSYVEPCRRAAMGLRFFLLRRRAWFSRSTGASVAAC